MSTISTNDENNRAEPPLWSIGIALVIILLAPLVLYSWAPTGPIREGDTVFSEGQQHVQIRHTATGGEAKDNTCLLDPNSPLIVVHSLNTDRWLYHCPRPGQSSRRMAFLRGAYRGGIKSSSGISEAGGLWDSTGDLDRIVQAMSKRRLDF